MLNIAKQNHLAVFDSRNYYVVSFTFGLVLPQQKNKQNKQDNQQQQQVTIKDEYKANFYIQNRFTYQWDSDYFDIEIQNGEGSQQQLQFGQIPFSLQTFLQIYKNPKLWDISLRPKYEDMDINTIAQKGVGKLIIKSHFIGNPFIVPIQCLTHSLQADKMIKVIVEDVPEEQVVSSAELVMVEDAIVGEDTFVWGNHYKNAHNQNYKIYTLVASQKICSENICIIKGKFQSKVLDNRGKKIYIYSANKPIYFIPNLQKIMKMLKFIDNDIIIFQNVQTQIQDSYRLVFFTDLTTLYAKIFRSYLYSKIFDKWIIQGMVHYSRDNRHFQDIMQELTDLLTEGEQLFPLSNGDYSFDYVWKVKAKFIYHVLANLSDSDLTQLIMFQFSKKKKKLTSALIFKRMKNTVGKDKMKTIYEHQFINSTGINRVFYEMYHQKKQHKIRITLRQRSLVCGVFRRYNRIRIKLEESFGLVSPIIKRIIKKNEGKKNQLTGPLAVPKFIKCLPYFVGPVSIEIQNSEPFEEQLQEQNIFQKVIDAKANLRTRRTVNKKNEQEPADTISWMMMDTGVTFPAIYKGKNLTEGVIQSLVKKSYENEIQELKVLNSISIKEHSESISICKLLIQKIKIKPNKQNSKISVKRKILQILPNFISKSKDILVWDQILQLLQLYEPVCYDYSEQGNLFLLSLIESIGNISYTLKFNIYFEQFHRIFLAISKYHQCINEQKFQFLHKQIFKSIMKWNSKYSFQILQQAKNYLQLTILQPKLYISLNKIIIQNVLPYIDQLKINEDNYKVARQIRELVKTHILEDKTGTIRSVHFQYETKIRQNTLAPLQFLNATFSELEKIKQNYFDSYDKCLDKFKQVLNQNKDRYACDLQLTILNEDQSYFLAEYLWKSLCSPQSLHNPKIRLAWIKIYRIFYFYFTPIVTMIKLNKNIKTKQFPFSEQQTCEILDNIMDFIPDIKWFSVYDSSNNKKKKQEKKKQVEEYVFEDDEKSLFTVFMSKNPGKDTPQQLTKYALTYLLSEYQNQEIRTAGEQKYKKIIDGIKAINQLLKRGNMKSVNPHEEVPERVYRLLEQFDEDTTVAKQVFDLLGQVLKIMKRQRKDKQIQKDGDMKISLLSFDFNKSKDE